MIFDYLIKISKLYHFLHPWSVQNIYLLHLSPLLFDILGKQIQAHIMIGLNVQTFSSHNTNEIQFSLSSLSGYGKIRVQPAFQ